MVVAPSCFRMRATRVDRLVSHGAGELPLHLGGDAEEVAEVKGLVMDLVNAVARCWEALPLPPHMGGKGWAGFVLAGYGSTTWLKVDCICQAICESCK